MILDYLSGINYSHKRVCAIYIPDFHGVVTTFPVELKQLVFSSGEAETSGRTAAAGFSLGNGDMITRRVCVTFLQST